MQPLAAAYHEWICSSIDEDGISFPHGLAIDADGGMTAIAVPPPEAYAFMLRAGYARRFRRPVPPPEAYAFMLQHWATRRPVEMIFALDRFAAPAQGTTLGDLMAGQHFVAGQPARPFIVEYQHAPRIVHPIAWDNAWWNAALTRELAQSLHALGLHR